MRTHRRPLILAAILLVSLIFAAVALAGAPKSGHYTVKGQVKFSFRLKPGSCYLPPKNLKNPNAGHGRLGQGLCFTSNSQLHNPVPCPAGSAATEIAGITGDFSELSGVRVPSDGILHFKSYSGSGNQIDGWFELDLKISGSHASGYVKILDYEAEDPSVACQTSDLTFHGSRS